MNATTQPVSWRLVLSGEHGRLVFGVFLCEVAVAMQILVAASSMPAAVHDIGGLQYYGMALSASALGNLIVTPFAGRMADSRSAGLVLEVSAFLAVAGMLVCAAAPAMSVLVLGRLLVGAANGSQYVVSLSGVARLLPGNMRARVFALMSLGWVVPGLVGPPLGGALASTIGWRWAFLVPLPLVIVSRILVLPPLRHTHLRGDESSRLQMRTALLLGAGGAALALGVSTFGPGGAVLVAAGAIALGIAITGVIRRPDSPLGGTVLTVLSGNLLLNCAYFAGEGFVPLAVNSHGGTLVQAGLALTVSSVAWALASWWQSRLSATVSPRALCVAGTLLILLGGCGVALSLGPLPTALAYPAWAAAGVGMGLAHTTNWVLSTSVAQAGAEGAAVAGMLIGETLGFALGTALVGGALAAGQRSRAPILETLTISFMGVAVVAAGDAMVSLRYPPRPLSGRE